MKKPEGLIFRENWKTHNVEARVGDLVVFASSEYYTVAEWAKSTYGLTDSELLELYRDYKLDYDA